jgi:CheY-like chemotaxis protein
LILDLSLPDGDGLSFVEWLRSSQQLRYLPLIVYSAHDVGDDERTRLRLGPTEFLTKARVQPNEVQALVRAMLHPVREIYPGPIPDTFFPSTSLEYGSNGTSRTDYR